MADKRWQKNDDGSESTMTVRIKDGVKETHHLTTAGGGTKKDHSHIVIRETESGRKTAHANTRKSRRN
jgi:hypothetical protein